MLLINDENYYVGLEKEYIYWLKEEGFKPNTIFAVLETYTIVREREKLARMGVIPANKIWVFNNWMYHKFDGDDLIESLDELCVKGYCEEIMWESERGKELHMQDNQFGLDFTNLEKAFNEYKEDKRKRFENWLDNHPSFYREGVEKFEREYKEFTGEDYHWTFSDYREYLGYQYELLNKFLILHIIDYYKDNNIDPKIIKPNVSAFLEHTEREDFLRLCCEKYFTEDEIKTIRSELKKNEENFLLDENLLARYNKM